MIGEGSSIIEALNASDPITIVTQLIILTYIAYETRKGKIKEIEEITVAMVTVIRAIARTNNDINSSKVDEYLLENGVSPQHFIDRDENPDNNKRENIQAYDE